MNKEELKNKFGNVKSKIKDAVNKEVRNKDVEMVKDKKTGKTEKSK
ncbi:MAG: hypothetical protein NDI69_06455 [Bacteriovoracaceae bacterium]|nr:hypothetical protein [Bacteriovoracaceae bacterium]